MEKGCTLTFALLIQTSNARIKANILDFQKISCTGALNICNFTKCVGRISFLVKHVARCSIVSSTNMARIDENIQEFH